MQPIMHKIPKKCTHVKTSPSKIPHITATIGAKYVIEPANNADETCNIRAKKNCAIAVPKMPKVAIAAKEVVPAGLAFMVSNQLVVNKIQNPTAPAIATATVAKGNAGTSAKCFLTQFRLNPYKTVAKMTHNASEFKLNSPFAFTKIIIAEPINPNAKPAIFNQLGDCRKKIMPTMKVIHGVTAFKTPVTALGKPFCANAKQYAGIQMPSNADTSKCNLFSFGISAKCGFTNQIITHIAKVKRKLAA